MFTEKDYIKFNTYLKLTEEVNKYIEVLKVAEIYLVDTDDIVIRLESKIESIQDTINKIITFYGDKFDLLMEEYFNK